jgi:hypothetical protein
MIGDSKRYIGRAVGMGEPTLSEALEGLKGYVDGDNNKG